MLNAILNSKSGRLQADSGEKIPWRELFRENEDLVTATVIERFSYMCPVKVWNILSSAAETQLPRYQVAEISKIEFWPRWPHRKRKRCVEPDVFIEFKLGDPTRLVHVIVEAKHGTRQDYKQLMIEIESYKSYRESEKLLADEVYILALGGVGNFIDEAEFCGAVRRKMPEIRFAGLISIGWNDLAKAVSTLSEETTIFEQENRLLSDITKSLALFGYRHRVVPRQLESLQPLQDPNKTLSVLIKSNSTFER